MRKVIKTIFSWVIIIIIIAISLSVYSFLKVKQQNKNSELNVETSNSQKSEAIGVNSYYELVDAIYYQNSILELSDSLLLDSGKWMNSKDTKLPASFILLKYNISGCDLCFKNQLIILENLITKDSSLSEKIVIIAPEPRWRETTILMKEMNLSNKIRFFYLPILPKENLLNLSKGLYYSVVNGYKQIAFFTNPPNLPEIISYYLTTATKFVIPK